MNFSRNSFDSMYECEEVEEVFEQAGFWDIVQNSPHHIGTLVEHTEKVCEALLKMPIVSSDLQIAALFHDIGKLGTVSVNPKTGYDQYLGHAEKSAEMFESLVDGGLGDNSDELFCARELIRLHDTRYVRQDKCRDMLNAHPAGFGGKLIALQLADVLGQSDFEREAKLDQIEAFARLIKEVGTPEQAKGIDAMLYAIDEVREDFGEKTFLARTRSNENVFVSNKTLEHMKAHPDVNLAHIVEAVGKLPCAGEYFIKAVDLGRVIGKDRCVAVTDDNKGKVQLRKRKGRAGNTPVLLAEDGFEFADTSKIVIGICRPSDGRYTLFTAYYGDLAPKEPWDGSLTVGELAESTQFWASHALVVDQSMLELEGSD